MGRVCGTAEAVPCYKAEPSTSSSAASVTERCSPLRGHQGTQSFGIVFGQGLLVQLIVADYVDRFAFGQELRLFSLRDAFRQMR